MKRFALLFAAGAGALVAAGGDGIRPRPDKADYPAHESAGAITIAAAVLSPAEVRNAFSSELNRGYLVVEVAVYPGERLEVSPDDFMLRIGGQDIVRPVKPQTVAGVLHRKSQPRPSSPGDIDVYPTVGIGYETGGRDPVSGHRYPGGWRTSAGVGVGVGSGAGGPAAPPASTGKDRQTMAIELEEKGLPRASTREPVAGCLYFPLPASKKKAASYQLDYSGPAGRAKLRLFEPAARR